MKLMQFAGALALSVLASATAATALEKVSDRNEFVRIVTGKTLTRPLVRIEVTSDGRLSGIGAQWDITGNWSWQNGYFCRDINWGGDDLAYNCQEVSFDGRRIRFQSDQGTGRYADFRLR